LWGTSTKGGNLSRQTTINECQGGRKDGGAITSRPRLEGVFPLKKPRRNHQNYGANTAPCEKKRKRVLKPSGGVKGPKWGPQKQQKRKGTGRDHKRGNWAVFRKPPPSLPHVRGENLRSYLEKGRVSSLKKGDGAPARGRQKC